MSVAQGLMTVAQQVCQAVALQWPLSQWVAVNPFWHYRHQPLADVAAQWRYAAGSHLLMSPAFYWRAWEAGQIDPALTTDAQREQLQQRLSHPKPVPEWRNLSRWVDAYQQRRRKMRWNDEVVLQISQTCGLFMQFPTRFQQAGADTSLYQHWLTIARADRGIETLMDESDLNALFADLPDTPDQLVALCEQQLLPNASDCAQRCYSQALISDVWGWAAALAYQDAQHGSRWVYDLFCIRLAWEWVLWQLAERTNTAVYEQLQQAFRGQVADCEQHVEAVKSHQTLLWQWQTAYEASQLKLLAFTPRDDTSNDGTHTTAQRPDVQAVFCIDVRLERYRRALEAAGQAEGHTVQGKGFAGFFGLPMGVQDKYRDVPHVPGLLSPSYYVRAAEPKHSVKSLLGNVFNAPVSMFTGIEALGLSKLKALVAGERGQLDVGNGKRLPDSTLYQNGQPVTDDTLVDVCEQALAGMQFDHFAAQIVLMGHGSHHSNNAQRAGFNCGACGGQSGALSARVLVQILNRTDIRAQLRERGTDIPDDTTFYAALHETVTDRIEWLSDNAPKALRHFFGRASDALGQSANTALSERKKRSNDWAELRPEWGLADNHVLFFGRASRLADSVPSGAQFLHDYCREKDPQGELLAQLFSAPGLVAHWINAQYYCSVTSPRQLGSGNKLLHNRVANDIGVFEGNGGDLRQGLAWQSVHNGTEFVHRPIRLQVIVDAEDDAIRAALGNAPDFHSLVQHGWVTLYRLNSRGALCPITP